MDEGDQGDDYYSKEIRVVFSRLLGELEGSGGDTLHLEPLAERYRVRLRFAGKLHDSALYPTLPPRIGRLLAGHMKLVSTIRPDPLPHPMDGEARLADGRRFELWSQPLDQGARPRPLDVRPGLAPRRPGAPRRTLAGPETVVLRITEARAGATPRTLEELVPDEADRRLLASALGPGQGLVLVAGPRGSGKRTVIRACLRREAAAGRHTAEAGRYQDRLQDPDGVTQLLSIGTCGYDALDAARRAASLGVDLVGVTDALRDRAAAEHVVDMALSGTRVLASLWGSDAIDAAGRLGDLGLDRARVARALRLVVAVRLLPRLCPECKAPSPRPIAAELRRHSAALAAEVEAGQRAPRLCEPRGCPACCGTGRRGRLLVTELLPLDGDARSAPLVDGACLRERLQVRRTLRDAALALALRGEVSLEDALEAI